MLHGLIKKALLTKGNIWEHVIQPNWTGTDKRNMLHNAIKESPRDKTNITERN